MSRAVRKDLALHPSVEHMPAILYDIDAANLHAGFELGEAKIRHADIAHLALLDDVIEGAHRLFERRVDIRPMHQIDIDVIGLQVPQALLDRRHYPLTTAVAPVRRLVVADPELGHHNDIAAARPERPRQRLLGDAHAIGFGSIKAVDAAVDRPLHRLAKLGLVDPAIGAADLPAAKADRRDPQVGPSKLPIFHVVSLIARLWGSAPAQSGAPSRGARELHRFPAS